MRSAIASSLLLAVASAASLPAADLKPRQAGVITRCTQPGVMAATFDDGPFSGHASIAQQFSDAGARATFFVNGNNYDCIYNYADALRASFNGGHQIASHTWAHANLEGLSPDQIQAEMGQLENALANILGVKPRYMRPPEGAAGGSVVPTVSGMGYQIINWNVDTQDWSGIPAADSEAAIEQAGTDGNGHIVLMHETVQSTVDQIVPWLLGYAASRGLQLVTVAECLGDGGGAHEPASGDGATTC